MATHPVTSRSTVREAMDGSSIDPCVLDDELRVLRRLNRMTSSAPLLVSVLRRRLAPSDGDSVSLLDFGAGGGDVARDFAMLARRQGWNASVVATDRSAQCLEACRAADAAGTVQYREVDLLHGAEVLGDGAADVSHASLVLHHLEDHDVVCALRQMSRCARRLVVWNDLLRERIGELGAVLATIGASGVTRADAVTSVRRGFTLNEAEAFAEAAGLVDIEVRRWRGGRFVLSARPGREPAANRPLLRATSVSFSYPGTPVLHDYSVVLRAGEMVLLHGANGSGKTTILRILAGALRPESGRVWCDRIRGAVGFLPQQHGLFSALDIGANIETFQRLAGVPPCDRGSRARDAIACFGLQDLLARRIGQLSIGQGRRAALATVFASAGEVVLLDEPDAGLDAAGREALGHAVLRHCASGGAIMMATHQDVWIESLCGASSIALLRSAPR